PAGRLEKERGPHATGTCPRPRPCRRIVLRDDPGQRPHARLCAREQRVLELMAMTQWLEELRGDTVVVKFGGNAMIDDALADAFCEDIVALQRGGIRVVVTHGGGPQI